MGRTRPTPQPQERALSLVLAGRTWMKSPLPVARDPHPSEGHLGVLHATPFCEHKRDWDASRCYQHAAAHTGLSTWP